MVFEHVRKPGEPNPRNTTIDGQVELSAKTQNQAEISGKLLTAMGQGIPHARVTLTDTAGQTRSILANGFGLYRFGGLQVGQTYTISVASRMDVYTVNGQYYRSTCKRGYDR